MRPPLCRDLAGRPKIDNPMFHGSGGWGGWQVVGKFDVLDQSDNAQCGLRVPQRKGRRPPTSLRFRRALIGLRIPQAASLLTVSQKYLAIHVASRSGTTEGECQSQRESRDKRFHERYSLTLGSQVTRSRKRRLSNCFCSPCVRLLCAQIRTLSYQFELVCMAPPSLWSGNLRLSLVLIPVSLVPAVSTEEAVSFRQIHEPSGNPIKCRHAGAAQKPSRDPQCHQPTPGAPGQVLPVGRGRWSWVAGWTNPCRTRAGLPSWCRGPSWRSIG